MTKEKSNQKNVPMNPQKDEVVELNRNWNKINLKIPGVRAVTQSYMGQAMGAGTTKVYNIFEEIVNKAVTLKRVQL